MQRLQQYFASAIIRLTDCHRMNWQTHWRESQRILHHKWRAAAAAQQQQLMELKRFLLDAQLYSLKTTSNRLAIRYLIWYIRDISAMQFVPYSHSHQLILMNNKYCVNTQELENRDCVSCMQIIFHWRWLINDYRPQRSTQHYPPLNNDVMFSLCWFVCLSGNKISRLLKTLWTDFHETWWV